MKFMRDAFSGALLLAVVGAVSILALPPVQAADQPKGAAEREQAALPKCREAKAGGPEEVVRTLYREYPIDGTEVIKNEPREVLDRFFDPRFAALLAEDHECQVSSGSLCELSWNIMYATQDADEVTDFRVCEMDPGTHTVNVRFRSLGHPETVTYKLVSTKSGWRISDLSGLARTLSKRHGELAAAWARAQAPEPPAAPGGKHAPLPYCEPAKMGGPEDMVRALYEKYPWTGEKIIINEPSDVLGKYFDEKLVAAIVDDRQCRDASPGKCAAMPNLMINHDRVFSQNISGFRICAMDASTKTINVQFRDEGTPVIIGYKLTDTDAGARISDILYTDLHDHSNDWSMLRGAPSARIDVSADQIQTISKGVQKGEENTSDARECSSFTMTKQQVAEFFKRAKRVPDAGFHDLNWSPCFFAGTLTKDRNPVKWEINTSCAASIWSHTGQTVFYHYGDCRLLLGRKSSVLDGHAASPPEKKRVPPCQDAKPGGPEEVVRTLYAQYPFDGNTDITDEARKVLAKFFDDNLTALLHKNQECRRTQEICSLDGNILYSLQNPKISDVHVCAMDAGKNTVSVQFRNFGEPMAVTHKLTRTNAGWRISDIVDPGSVDKPSVVQVLSPDELLFGNVEDLRKTAEGGYAEAQFSLGEMYAAGLRVERDGAEAVKWYRRAALQGHIQAQLSLGVAYRDGLAGVDRDAAQAAEWFRRAADGGDAEAQVDLAELYIAGQGVPRDDARAQRWYRKAAQGGHPDAILWFREAAEQGDASAQFILGDLYSGGGRGVTKNQVEAVKWYRRAAEQGHTKAQRRLAVAYRDGRGVARDQAEADKWLGKAAGALR